MPYQNEADHLPFGPEAVKICFEYNPETGQLFRKHKTHKVLCSCKNGAYSGAGYIVVGFKGKSYRATTIIWLLVHGRLPNGHIEHKNRITFDDRLANLREATPSQNGANKTVTVRSKSGVKGVFWDKSRGKWTAFIGHNYKRINLGRYNTKEEAKAAYDKKALELFGEFACL